MGYLLAQGGASLYKIDPSTGVATTLTLPSGVTLSTTRVPKFAVLNQFVAIVNSPSVNLVVDPEGTVRVMVPRAPFSGPFLATGGGTGYTGTRAVKASFIVKDSADTVIMESPLSPPSPSVTFTNQNMSITRVPISPDSISARRLYTTVTNGTSYFFLMDVDDNVGTTALSSLVDASLSLLPAASSLLVSPPGTFPNSRLRNIVSWKSRFWAVGSDPSLVDTIYYTESNSVYKWPNSLVAYPTGQDSEGVVAFAPRKDQLGVLKRDGLWQISGQTSGASGIASPGIFQIGYGKGGCIAPDSVVTVNDTVYWLGNDGVWEWSSEGLKNISDSAVKPWFERDSTVNTYFNPAYFASCFARYNPKTDSIEFHLASAGQTTMDRWVSFNRNNRRWYGPHKTAAFTPTYAHEGRDANNLPVSLVGGSDGVIYVANSPTFTDGTSSAVDFDCYGPWHSQNAPDIEHFWGSLSVLSRIEAAGSLSLTPYLGGLNASAGTPITHDLTKGRQSLGIIGDGRLMRLRLQQNVNAQGVSIMGYEVDTVFENGRH